MDRIQLLDAVERFLRDEMSPDEKYAFEHLRKTNPEVDQIVVEHTVFLNELDKLGQIKNFKATLHDVHNDLSEKGIIKPEVPKAVIRHLWKRHKRVMGVAASIAGITTLIVASMVNYYSRQSQHRPTTAVEQKI